MIRKRAFVIFLMFAVASAATVLAQRQAKTSDASLAPLLTLDDAVSIALDNNRLVKISALEAQKFDFRVSTVRSRRLPQFQFAALGGELMHSFDFTFGPGMFGTYPNVGPIPGSRTKTCTPIRFTSNLTGNADQRAETIAARKNLASAEHRASVQVDYGSTSV